MFLRELLQSVTVLKGVGSEKAGSLARLGITNIAALLCHYPRDWEDWGLTVPLKDWKTSQVCADVQIVAKDWFGYGPTKTLKLYVEDETARVCLKCFKQPFLETQFPIGIRARLLGRFEYKYGEIQSKSFKLKHIRNVYGPILPVYPLTAGVKLDFLRNLTRQAVSRYAKALENELPESVITRDGLFHKADAVRAIHFPASWQELDRARKTLIYEELFYLEVMVAQRSLQRKANSSGHEVAPQNEDLSKEDLSSLQKRLLERLPFALTPGQKSAVAEINRDMDSPFPMARLLQGDVGSGKTLVSFLAALKAVEAGGQAALMAPTELLARQHAESAARLLEPLCIRIAFLTGNLKASGRANLLKALSSGDIDMIAGTHALFSRDVEYKNLRLVVVDEQHRFGVLQRQAITAKGNLPNLLMMSATPIPRSLALTVFGDLDVSVIADLPPGRKAIKTHLAKESNEGKVYDFVRRELEAGRQAYFVYPLIEGGDESSLLPYDLKDAVSMADRLAKEVFPDFPLALLHSKVDDEDKRKAMEAFRRGEIKILAATSVVEVGVDVPNATCMVIEHAERFGLSALHQLRGRVGRGEDQSYCFLVYSDNLGDDGKKRLMVMLENSSGFVIAEEDLKLRGPGQIVGVEQSGYLKLGLADPVRDAEDLVRARSDVFEILESDPALEKPPNKRIAEVLERCPPFSEVGL